MAYIQMNIMSERLMRTVPVTVILPVDKIRMPDQMDKEIKIRRDHFPTLYLLHGIFGDHLDWVNGTMIERWAMENNLCVVMPAGENRCYVDDPKTHSYYGEFVGKELVEITRNMFPLSQKREDTFIAGLSMGGFGALRNGLKYSDTFSCIGAFSAANLLDIPCPGDSPFFQSKAFLEGIFGNLDAAKQSDDSIDWLIDHHQKENMVDQKIYMACGTEDSLLEVNRKMKEHFLRAGYALTYEEGPGGHQWEFWNKYIEKFLGWLPLAD